MSTVVSQVPIAAATPAERLKFIDMLRAVSSQLLVWHHLAFYGPLAEQAYPLARCFLIGLPILHGSSFKYFWSSAASARRSISRGCIRPVAVRSAWRSCSGTAASGSPIS